MTGRIDALTHRALASDSRRCDGQEEALHVQLPSRHESRRRRRPPKRSCKIRRRSATFSRSRSYVWFWVGAVCNRLSVQVQAIALAWQVYAVARQTASVAQASLAVGMLGLAQFLPMFALTLFAGHAADIYDRRKIMMAGLGLQLLHLGPVRRDGLWRAEPSLADLRGRGFVRLRPGLLYAVERRARADPGRAAADPARDRASIRPAIRWRPSSAPPSAGSWWRFRPLRLSSCRARLCLASLVSLMLVESPPRQPRPTASRWALIAEGLNYVWTTKVVLGAISLDLFAVLLGGVTALLPVYARDILHVGPEGFGILRAAPSAGAIVTGFVLAARPLKVARGPENVRSRRDLRPLHLGVRLVALDGLERRGARDSGRGRHGLGLRAPELVQIVTPDPMRGRVSAVSSLFIGASNELGEFESGGMARLLGPVGSAIFGGCGAIVVTLLWAGIFPALRKADRLE